jgi:amino-acid N-acetyltransferase
MDEVEFARVRVDDVRPLLLSSGLPIEDLDDERVCLIGVVEGGALAGCVGFERYGEDGLLRSLAVAPDRGGCGIGAALLHEAIVQAGADGCRAVWGVTTNAEKYLARFGFEVVARDSVPGALAESTQLRGVCPDDAVVMRQLLRLS